METIQRLSNERYELYVKAGHGPLSIKERERLSEINRELPRQWDQYRRELAASRRQLRLMPSTIGRDWRRAA